MTTPYSFTQVAAYTALKALLSPRAVRDRASTRSSVDAGMSCVSANRADQAVGVKSSFPRALGQKGEEVKLGGHVTSANWKDRPASVNLGLRACRSATPGAGR